MNRKWYRLDNAALIFPSTMNSSWANGFRISFSLKQEVDVEILKKAINDLKDRFPSFFVRLRKGIFWYYLEENKDSILLNKDYAYPLTFFSTTELKKSCIRVLYYKNRIAVEFFHAVSDGSGGLIFVKNLANHYLELKYNIKVEYKDDILDLNVDPKDYELEDDFIKTCGKYTSKRNKSNGYHLKGTLEKPKFNNLVTATIDTSKLLELSHKYNATITSFLAGVMIESFIKYQRSIVPESKLKPVKVTIPVNLRKLYNTKTLRNFVLVVNPGVDPKTGDYKLEDIINIVSSQIKIDTNPNIMRTNITSNVKPSNKLFMKLTPLFIKSLVLKIVYKFVGENEGCLNISNLGNCNVPSYFYDYIDRFEFILCPAKYYPDNCSVISYNSKTYINMIRRIKESKIEQLFFSRLVELGLEVSIESNYIGGKK